MYIQYISVNIDIILFYRPFIYIIAKRYNKLDGEKDVIILKVDQIGKVI